MHLLHLLQLLCQRVHLKLVVWLQWLLLLLHLLLHLLLLILLHSLLLYFFGNRCIVNYHSYATAATSTTAAVIIIVSRRTAVSTAFSAASLFIILFVSRGIHGDNAESIAQIRCMCVKCVFAGLVHNLLAVLLLEGSDDVLVNERRNVKEVLDVGLDDVHHVFGIHALRTHEGELDLDFLVDLLELQGAESVRLGALAQLEVSVNGFDDPNKNAPNTENDVHFFVSNVNTGCESNRGRQDDDRDVYVIGTSVVFFIRVAVQNRERFALLCVQFQQLF